MTSHPSHPREALISTALADLDAAPATALTPEQHARADQVLAAILASDPAATPRTVRPGWRRRRTRALLLLAAAVVPALVLSVGGPFGGGSQAYASWTATPVPRPSAEQAVSAQQCRDALAVGADGAHGTPSAADLQATDLVVADSRGEWTYVVLAGEKGLEATCMTEKGSSRVWGIFPRPTTAAGSYGFMADMPKPNPNQIIGTGLMSIAAGEGSVWSTEGHVGRNVAGVTVVTTTGARIEATVTQGRFAAWWPSGESVEVDGTPPRVAYVVTLTNGRQLPPVEYDGIGPAWQE